MLLTLDDLKEKIDFTKTKNLTPFQWLLKLTPIALEKLHRQERLAKERKLKRPMGAMLAPPTITQEQYDQDDDDDDYDDDEEEEHDQGSYRQETQNPPPPPPPPAATSSSKKRLLRGDKTKKKTIRRKIDIDYFVGDPELEQATIPERFRRYIETELKGRDIKLMLQKHLYQTDPNPNEGRLSMPLKKMRRGVLTTQEEEWLRRRGGSHKAVPGVELRLVVEPEVGVEKILFKLWEMKKPSGKTSYMYVLARYWNGVVKAHGLEAGEVVQVWGFRIGGGGDEPGELGLALVRLDKENGGEDDI